MNADDRAFRVEAPAPLPHIGAFGMDTISLAGTLPAKLDAVRDAGFSQIMLSARDVVSHAEGFDDAVRAVRRSGLRVTGFQVLRDFEGLDGPLHDYKIACPAYTLFTDGQPCRRCVGGTVANAVVHGRPDSDGTIELTCEVDDDALVVRVRDAGSRGAVEPRALEPEVGHGRGLAIVDALSSSWSVDRTDGTVVIARVPLGWQSA